VARIRPGSDRPLRVTETEEPDDPDEGDNEDDDQDDQPQQTSLADLTTEADPQQFDRTFTTADADYNILGRFDPVPSRKQVIPRVAYTVNFQMVWNEDRQRWEPQKKSRLADNRSASIYQAGGNDQPLPDNGDRITVEFTDSELDSLGGVDPGNNRITAPSDGEYLISINVRLNDAGDTDDLDAFGRVDGEDVILASTHATSNIPLNLTATGIVNVSENDTIDVQASQTNGTGVSTLSQRRAVYLQVTRLRGL
jgi:hypothetical protein